MINTLHSAHVLVCLWTTRQKQLKQSVAQFSDRLTLYLFCSQSIFYFFTACDSIRRSESIEEAIQLEDSTIHSEGEYEGKDVLKLKFKIKKCYENISSRFMSEVS